MLQSCGRSTFCHEVGTLAVSLLSANCQPRLMLLANCAFAAAAMSNIAAEIIVFFITDEFQIIRKI